MGHPVPARRLLLEYYLRGAGHTPDLAAWETQTGWPGFRAGRAG